MSKRALVVACSCAGTEMELSGTMADASAIFKMLQETLGVDGGDIKFYNEGGQYSEFPSGTAVRTSLKEIASSCAEGDSLLFYFSGNGVRLPAPPGAAPKWGLLVSDLDVLTREDFNDVLASLPPGCQFTAVIDSACSHGMFPHPVANGADEKPRMFKAEGGRFVPYTTYLNAFNEKYPDASMQLDNVPQVLLATFPDQPSKFTEVAEAEPEGEPVAEALEENLGPRPRRRWGRYTPPGAVAEGMDGEGEEEEEDGRRERRERNDEEGDRRRRNRRGRRRNEDGEEEECEGDEEEEGEEEPEEEPAEEEPAEEEPAEEEAPPAEEEAPPAEEEAPPPEEEAPPAEAPAEGFEADYDFPAPVSVTDGSVEADKGTLLAAGMFRSYVADGAEGGAFTRALVNAVAVGKEANPEGLSNLSLMEAIVAALGEGNFNMNPALVCSEGNSEVPFYGTAA